MRSFITIALSTVAMFPVNAFLYEREIRGLYEREIRDFLYGIMRM